MLYMSESSLCLWTNILKLHCMLHLWLRDTYQKAFLVTKLKLLDGLRLTKQDNLIFLWNSPLWESDESCTCWACWVCRCWLGQWAKLKISNWNFIHLLWKCKQKAEMRHWFPSVSPHGGEMVPGTGEMAWSAGRWSHLTAEARWMRMLQKF